MENLKSYLPEEEHAQVRSEYYKALDKESFEDAKVDLLELESRIRPLNISATNSLLEGLDEILTLHRTGIDPKLWQTFRSTSCIENLNSQLGKYIRKVKHWQTSDQRHRWIASGLPEIENKMPRIKTTELYRS